MPTIIILHNFFYHHHYPPTSYNFKITNGDFSTSGIDCQQQLLMDCFSCSVVSTARAIGAVHTKGKRVYNLSRSAEKLSLPSFHMFILTQIS